MKLNCLIVDDEPLAIKVLEAHIANIPSLTVGDTCGNAFTAMDILRQGKTDLMFLDIHMPKLMGHEFLRTLRSPPKVIFTTAYREYALDAFELDAIDYLVKPVTLERLLKAVIKSAIQLLPNKRKKLQLLKAKDLFISGQNVK